MNRTALLLGVAIAPLAFGGMAQAQTQTTPQEAPETTVEEVIVTGQPAMRNRTEDVVPTLSYDLEFFQRFEPLTVGDALKRVPSVTFLSDVLESDGVRLRGLDPGYTQILINGEQVPGAGVDRSFFVDRIPAELIERIEVVRSSSANRSGDAVAGAINIVLRDAYTLDGGYLRAGTTRFGDGEFVYSGGAVYGGRVGPGRLLLGANAQDRYNPKLKFSQRFDEPGGELDNVEVQTDTRDGTDYSFNAAYELDVAGGELELTGLFVRTDRIETEQSLEYAEGIISNDTLVSVNDNVNDITTDNYAVGARYQVPMAGGETTFRVGYAGITDEQFEFENQFVYDEDDTPFPDDDLFESTLIDYDIEDTELSGRIAHERPLGANTLEFGLDYRGKTRDTAILVAENEVEIDDAPAPRPAIPGTYSDFEAEPGGISEIEETRIDPYVMLSGDSGRVKWEVGLRYETTELTIDDATADIGETENDFGILLPSASLRINLSERDRFTLSAARTVRRPNFDLLSPAVFEEERGDNDFRGNPNLEPETAWGVDVGFERRLGRRGVVGINAFYRDVTDLIEDVGLAEEGSGGPGTIVESVDNVGDGQVYGVEFDLSTPLDMFGMENTGVFLNYSWLDSQVEDFLGERRFNDQSDYVVNFGFTHDIPTWGAAFGATYRKQGDAFGRIFAEEVTTSYGENLEAFVEKQVGRNTVVRLTASNLLDATKDEVFDKFDNLEDQIARDYDEFEVESENAQGAVYQLVMRVAF